MATKKASARKSAKKTSAAKPVVKRTVVKSVSAKTRNTSAKDVLLNAPLGALFGEFIGTFLLASVVVATQGQPIFVLFALAVIVLMVGNLSGAHVNPAITFGAWISRKVSSKRAVFYVLAQSLGAMFAFVLLTYLLQGSAAESNPLTGQTSDPELYKATQVTSENGWYAFVASLTGLAIFGFAVASALRERKEQFAAAFTVGGGLFLGLIVAGQTAILNPAVALTLQAFTDLKGNDALTWAIAIHVIAPLIGAAIGFLLYDLFRRDVETSA